MAVNQRSAEELTTLIHRLQRQLRCIAQKIDDPQGPGTAMQGVMRVIGDHGEIRATELAEKLGIGTAGLSRHLSELVAMGYVSRRPHPGDGRAHLVSLTTAGTQAVAEEMRRRGAVLQHMLEDWTEEEARSASESLTRLTDTLQTSIRAMKPGTHPMPTPAGEDAK
ncbi:MarR family winged helix-turn-helix transcriptional regulator [Arthrobacter gengyunqii]|uniref:MarR family winged helix-turn-helix transcriptional regulator n=1 Tax=Arthrobacter gengyunqii TaxID=2886940 RepID=A0A9X1M3G1_9MICC|nr:MarR family winged helix-turn-helix transcriptional regulator [Arthrobacter gengyunqii]MCC3270678.1 MarR family winged helix-turn-helix transcriptional regulator [Arthrobacter gengyunqii]UOY96707.1 MarR family winged helix-turn-helix transcriptional regulator [Arthrobacter gengyunqii]